MHTTSLTSRFDALGLDVPFAEYHGDTDQFDTGAMPNALAESPFADYLDARDNAEARDGENLAWLPESQSGLEAEQLAGFEGMVRSLDENLEAVDASLGDILWSDFPRGVNVALAKRVRLAARLLVEQRGVDVHVPALLRHVPQRSDSTASTAAW